MRRKRISIDRRVGRIGFLGKGMRVPSRERSDIGHALGLRIGESRISTRESDCELCRNDASPRHGFLGRLFSRVPSVIASPDSAQCVADILDVCIEEKAFAVPRASATAGLGGATPVRGGVVIDVSRMARVLSVDSTERTVTVEAGCTWKALEEGLAGEGLGLRSYPSSARFSTVGGWMSTGGYGIGTLREGRFHKQVLSMEVALASGLVVTSSHDEGRYAVRTFAGTEGQMGVITKLALPVKAAPERSACYLIPLSDEQQGCEILRLLSDLEAPPFYAKMVNSNRSRLLTEWEGSQAGCGKPFVLVAEEGDERRVASFDGMLRQLGRTAGFEIEDSEMATKLWEDRFSYIDVMKSGSTAMAGEVILGVDKLPVLIEAMRMRGNLLEDLLYECHLVDRHQVLLVAGRPVEGGAESGLIRDVFTTAHIVSLAVASGGRPYGIGLWNTAYSRFVFGKEYGRLRLIKREIDRLGLLNPGKLFSMTTSSGCPVPGWLYRVLARGTRR